MDKCLGFTPTPVRRFAQGLFNDLRQNTKNEGPGFNFISALYVRMPFSFSVLFFLFFFVSLLRAWSFAGELRGRAIPSFPQEAFSSAQETKGGAFV